MALITEEHIRELAGFKGGDAPVVTMYLDVDGRRTPKFADVEARLDRLVRDASDRIGSNGSAGALHDLHKIQTHVRSGIDRSDTRGVAVFSCEPKGLWEVIELPVPVRDQVVVNTTPHVRQLELVVDQHERFGILLTDRQRTRMFVYELGKLVERSELFDALPRHDDDAGDRDRGHDRSHIEEAAHAHLRRAAEVAFRTFQDHPFDHLIIGAREDIGNELERDLHSYLRSRIAARVHVPLHATDATICDVARDVETEVEHARDATLVSKLRDAAGANRGAAVGLEAVLVALDEKRVDTLIVSDQYEAPGWRCPSCNYLCVKVAAGRHCPMCETEMHLEDDIVENAIEEALLQSCRVRTCDGNADLDVLGRIGALLRF